MSPQPTDTVFLRGLAIETTIGFFDWERHTDGTLRWSFFSLVNSSRESGTGASADVESRGSRPPITPSTVAASFTLRASGPM